MLRFLVKKTGDCGNPPTPKKPKTDAERLATAKEYEERGFKAAWRDEYAWLTYEPEVADSEANGSGAPAATGSDNTKPQYKMFCRPCCAGYSVIALMRLPDRGVFRKYSNIMFMKLVKQNLGVNY